MCQRHVHSYCTTCQPHVPSYRTTCQPHVPFKPYHVPTTRTFIPYHVPTTRTFMPYPCTKTLVPTYQVVVPYHRTHPVSYFQKPYLAPFLSLDKSQILQCLSNMIKYVCFKVKTAKVAEIGDLYWFVPSGDLHDGQHPQPPTENRQHTNHNCGTTETQGHPSKPGSTGRSPIHYATNRKCNLDLLWFKRYRRICCE